MIIKYVWIEKDPSSDVKKETISLTNKVEIDDQEYTSTVSYTLEFETEKKNQVMVRSVNWNECPGSNDYGSGNNGYGISALRFRSQQ